jgi:hypothetical protein
MTNTTHNPTPTVNTARYESTAAKLRRQETERAKIMALLALGKLPYEIDIIMGWDKEGEGKDG